MLTWLPGKLSAFGPQTCLNSPAPALPPLLLCRGGSAARKELNGGAHSPGFCNISFPPTGCIKARRKITVVQLLLQRAKETIHQAGFVGERESF